MRAAVALLLVSANAWAGDCREVAEGVLCGAETFHAIRVECDASADARDAALLKVVALEEKLASERERVTTPAVAPSILPWFVAGGATGAAVVAVLVLLAR